MKTAIEFDRRSFLKGTAIVGSAIALTGVAGCSGSKDRDASAASKLESAQSSGEAITADETMDVDICIVGSGMSGLSAAVAASAGDSTTVVALEANSLAGGNGSGTEGCFGCNSSLQKAAGIEFHLKDVITRELQFFNYRIDVLAWKDLVDATADNIDWLIDQGVTFGSVDTYHGQGQLEGFHWFAPNTKDGYITPMETKAENQGVQFVFETRAHKLLQNTGGEVCGVVAEKAGGTTLLVNAKAVILASGGYADNDDKLREMGVDPENIVRKGFPHHMGDGLDMAVAAGGVDTRAKHCIMREPGLEGYPFETPVGAMGLRSGGPWIFVNSNGERYTNENCIATNQAHAANAVLSQKHSFAIINQTVLEWLDSNTAPGIKNGFQDAIDTGASIWKADTIQDLAQAVGLPAETLTASLERYNEFCATGSDDDFAKDPEMLMPMADGPFYALKHGFFYFSTIGGISTDRQFRVLDAQDNPIPGLWAVGTDGCGLYRETYTVMIPGSCNANNINSGRQAGIAAAAYCRK